LPPIIKHDGTPRCDAVGIKDKVKARRNK
jgi:hypothetical protein